MAGEFTTIVAMQMTDAQKNKAHSIFEKFFILGFFGRDALQITQVQKFVECEVSNQAFHREWQKWQKEKLAETPDIMLEIKKLLEELSK